MVSNGPPSGLINGVEVSGKPRESGRMCNLEGMLMVFWDTDVISLRRARISLPFGERSDHYLMIFGFTYNIDI